MKKVSFFAKRICLRALEVDWWIQNYFIIKWVWFYNIFARIASLRPPRIRGPGGFQMVRCRTRRIQLGLNQTANLLLNSYFDIIFSWTKVQTNGRTVSTVLTIPKYKRIIFGKLFWKQLALNSQTPYIGCINWLPLRDFILWENQIKFNWGRLGSIWETSLF